MQACLNTSDNTQVLLANETVMIEISNTGFRKNDSGFIEQVLSLSSI